MKSLILAAAVATIASSAMAADVVYQAPAAAEPIVVAPAQFSWTGFHVGVQGGHGWSKFTERYWDGTESYKLKGGLVGGFIGYDHQFDNNLVLGIEGDIEKNWEKATDKDYIGGYTKFKNDLTGSVRARVGYAMDQTLIYATAGWATANVKVDVVADPGSRLLEENYKIRFNGYTVGAGLAYAFTDNMFAKVEYRYNDYGSKKFDTGKEELNEHVVKVGLGLKF